MGVSSKIHVNTSFRENPANASKFNVENMNTILT
jgi:hypothetical protein